MLTSAALVLEQEAIYAALDAVFEDRKSIEVEPEQVFAITVSEGLGKEVLEQARPVVGMGARGNDTAWGSQLELGRSCEGGYI